jgi:hypothetical protein
VNSLASEVRDVAAVFRSIEALLYFLCESVSCLASKQWAIECLLLRRLSISTYLFLLLFHDGGGVHRQLSSSCRSRSWVALMVVEMEYAVIFTICALNMNTSDESSHDLIVSSIQIFSTQFYRNAIFIVKRVGRYLCYDVIITCSKIMLLNVGGL